MRSLAFVRLDACEEEEKRERGRVGWVGVGGLRSHALLACRARACVLTEDASPAHARYWPRPPDHAQKFPRHITARMPRARISCRSTSRPRRTSSSYSPGATCMAGVMRKGSSLGPSVAAITRRLVIPSRLRSSSSRRRRVRSPPGPGDPRLRPYLYHCHGDGMGWDGMGRDGTGWDGMGRGSVVVRLTFFLALAHSPIVGAQVTVRRVALHQRDTLRRDKVLCVGSLGIDAVRGACLCGRSSSTPFREGGGGGASGGGWKELLLLRTARGEDGEEEEERLCDGCRMAMVVVWAAHRERGVLAWCGGENAWAQLLLLSPQTFSELKNVPSSPEAPPPSSPCPFQNQIGARATQPSPPKPTHHGCAAADATRGSAARAQAAARRGSARRDGSAPSDEAPRDDPTPCSAPTLPLPLPLTRVKHGLRGSAPGVAQGPSAAADVERPIAASAGQARARVVATRTATASLPAAAAAAAPPRSPPEIVIADDGRRSTSTVIVVAAPERAPGLLQPTTRAHGFAPC